MQASHGEEGGDVIGRYWSETFNVDAGVGNGKVGERGAVRRKVLPAEARQRAVISGHFLLTNSEAHRF